LWILKGYLSGDVYAKGRSKADLLRWLNENFSNQGFGHGNDRRVLPEPMTMLEI